MVSLSVRRISLTPPASSVGSASAVHAPSKSDGRWHANDDTPLTKAYDHTDGCGM